MVSPPREDRWHRQTTPTIGGIGIFAGLVVGVLVAVALGAVPGPDEPVPSSNAQVLGILGGCAILFVAGLLDDVFSLPPLAKIGAQLAAAAVVLAAGLKVTIVSNHWLALVLAVFWLVGMTNAFNMLDNMDGLAASLAAIASLFFAIDAATLHPNRAVLVVALALLAACLAFLPFNLRRSGGAKVFMGDSGSQVLGFALAACGLAATLERRRDDGRDAAAAAAHPRGADPRHDARHDRAAASRAGRSTRAVATTRRTGSCTTASRTGAR